MDRSLNEILALFTITIVILIMASTSFKWNGEVITYDSYRHVVEKECLIDNEWTAVDNYGIYLISRDYYRIDGEYTYLQGKDLSCRTDRYSIYLGEKEYYKKGIKDYVLFWKEVE